MFGWIPSSSSQDMPRPQLPLALPPERGLLLLGVLAPLAVFAAAAAVVATGADLPGDAAVYRVLNDYEATPAGDFAGGLAGVTIEVLGAVAMGTLFLLLVAGGRRREAAFVALTLVAPAITPLLKELLDREPPPDVSPLSGEAAFPSGHAIGATAVAAVVVVLAWPTPMRKLVLVASGGMVAAVGAAAVVEGVHWPSDVVAGCALAVAWACCVLLVVRPSAGSF
jgi:membrane-associated phospholipid phosphatase